jgi:hypothetical protein
VLQNHFTKLYTKTWRFCDIINAIKIHYPIIFPLRLLIFCPLNWIPTFPIPSRSGRHFMLPSGRGCTVDYSLTSPSSLSTQQCTVIHCSIRTRNHIERSHISASAHKAYSSHFSTIVIVVFSSTSLPSHCLLTLPIIHFCVLVITCSGVVIVGSAALPPWTWI